MNKLPTMDQISYIQKYYNIDEGFSDIAPEFLDPSVNPVLWHHISQLKYHRESLEKLLREEYDRLLSEELYGE